MNARMKNLFRIGCLVVVGAFLVAACNEKKEVSDSNKGSDAKPMKAPDKMGGSASTGSTQNSTAQAAPTKKTEAPVKVTPASTPPKQTTVTAAPTPPPKSETPAQPAAATDDEKRAQAEDLIYAQIRVKMEEAITKRADLLKSGRNPADTEVRQLEGVIMRARQLLTENGEVVEDVQPPIVQSKP